MNSEALKLMRKYHYGYRTSCDLLENGYIKDLKQEIEKLNKEKSILEKSLKLIWKKDIKIDYEELDKANKDIEKALKEGK